MNRKLIGLLALLVLPGCYTAAATTAAVPKERATECVKICTDLDMELGAVVIIRNSAGCVCSPKDKAATPEGAGAAAAGSAAAQVLEQEQQSGTYASQQGGVR
ncbi:hypothetical protein SAMN05443572_109108 [Myxococcus fulvus]|uniref:Lipoprotein n=1 Tax=Myxococcus fulvus TaxID=33 RepID=A0A511T693_MYXFU|nr:hypothetical protein [Myxococcus fulvus]AKF85917.1 hypothetical protein MFUL124B02_18570 [Myxococcus fulvus 124B02]GEN09457.1 hypothetical protein MFU01_44940 [Myxococcus fulvus]SEU32321.1 hypothetical protein SAMN05443572_109108 [Myxococcus fulvus]